jgi:hypothetical protein
MQTTMYTIAMRRGKYYISRKFVQHQLHSRRIAWNNTMNITAEKVKSDMFDFEKLIVIAVEKYGADGVKQGPYYCQISLAPCDYNKSFYIFNVLTHILTKLTNK